MPSYKKIFLALSCVFCAGAIYALPTTFELNNGWQFRQARLTNRYPATVPGTVHTDLLEQSRSLKTLSFSMNERNMQWIDKEDWIYENNL